MKPYFPGLAYLWVLKGLTTTVPANLLEHDAEKCGRFSDDIKLYFFDVDQDSDFRPIGPKIILI
ncbi:hypothetical protein [Rhizobium leguminosarum]|uniref:hypothetical protein n=1 Tax=Rhizobium leguminosarum TaxID=384 RepID=UPI001030AE4B|nr:hypothetical protein [Rhizobium leguminosarum]TAX34837.1 hypothetical protein ELI06_11275 [Rhizobium leguminosarum]